MAWWWTKDWRGPYDPDDSALGLAIVHIGNDLQDPERPEEVRSLERTLLRYQHQIAVWHEAHVSNGPIEAVSNLIKRVKRLIFGFGSIRNFRIRALLYTSKPN